MGVANSLEAWLEWPCLVSLNSRDYINNVFTIVQRFVLSHKEMMM